jgi:mono/diheme cytochrome c family protein
MCHGDNGNGKTDLATQMQLKMTDWTDPKALADMKDGELFDIIKNGKDKMPPEGDRVKTDDVWNLVIYVRSLGSEHSASAAKPGK